VKDTHPNYKAGIDSYPFISPFIFCNSVRVIRNTITLKESSNNDSRREELRKRFSRRERKHLTQRRKGKDKEIVSFFEICRRGGHTIFEV
jgi:hypothetical protein